MAKKYTFRFETLLRLRRQREDEHKRIVSRRLNEIRLLQQRQDTLLLRIHDQSELTRDALRDRQIDVDLLKFGRHWLIRLRRGVLDTEAQIAAQKAILAQERSSLREALKHRRILSELKERRYRRFTATEARREQAELDETSVIRFARAAGSREVHES
jgi:flagellar export protein FliJ